MTPKIIFRYSSIYDRHFQEFAKFKKWKRGYPSKKILLGFIKKIGPFWREHETKVLLEMSRVTGLPWRSKFIPCYIVGRGVPFSDPLTIRPYKNPDDFVDALVHELIHRIFTEESNFEQWKNSWNHIYRKYRNESGTTQIHIPLHAIHEHIYRKFFGENRLNRELRLIHEQGGKDYLRAWDIVKKEGYKNIIAAMRSRSTAKSHKP